MKTFFIDAKFDLKMFWIKCKKKTFCKTLINFFPVLFLYEEMKFWTKEKWKSMKNETFMARIFFFFLKKNFIRSMSRGAFSNLSNSICLEILPIIYWTVFWGLTFPKRTAFRFEAKKQRMRSIILSIQPKTLF